MVRKHGPTNMTDYQKFKFDILCEMMSLNKRQKQVLTIIVERPTLIHKQIASEANLSIGCERDCVSSLMHVFNARSTIALRDNIGYLLA